MEALSYFDLLLGLVIAIGAWWCKTQHGEVQRLSKLLSQTREEVAKEYVSVHRQQSDMDRVIDRLDRLETKLDRLFEK